MSKNRVSEKLSPKQYKAVGLVAVGIKDEDISKEVGVTRQTINRWKNPQFMEEVRIQRIEISKSNKERYRSLYSKTIDELENAFKSDDPKIRLDAAKFILRSVDPNIINETPKGVVHIYIPDNQRSVSLPSEH